MRHGLAWRSPRIWTLTWTPSNLRVCCLVSSLSTYGYFIFEKLVLFLPFDSTMIWEHMDAPFFLCEASHFKILNLVFVATFVEYLFRCHRNWFGSIRDGYFKTGKNGKLFPMFCSSVSLYSGTAPSRKTLLQLLRRNQNLYQEFVGTFSLFNLFLTSLFTISLGFSIYSSRICNV